MLLPGRRATPRLLIPYTCRLARFRNSCRSNSSRDNIVQVSEEVRQAIADGNPVLALESTIYTHGVPYPQNSALATSLESIVRSVGAVPATIGVLDGIARVGLTEEELLRLTASSQSPDTLLKVSRRDLAFALSSRTADGKRYTGGTTVAGTMVLAHLAGIKVFATGGLGGVHRGAAETFDVSADLTELGRTPVSVVAAGCKAFLDIPKTLEYLETQGVAVATFADGRAGNVDFPAFWSRDSGIKSPMTINNEASAAQMIAAQSALGLCSGMLFGNPVPKEYEIPLTEIQHSIDTAVQEAMTRGFTGNRATPFILAKIKELTGSRSVTTNTALVEHNVTVGSRIASELSLLEKGHQSRWAVSSNELSSIKVLATKHINAAGSRHLPTRPSESQNARSTGIDTTPQRPFPKVLVAGMLAVDLACDYKAIHGSSANTLELHTSNPARISQSLGGVGHNVARAVQLCGVSTTLFSAIGSDLNGTAALEALQKEDMDTNGIVMLQESSGRHTAQYVAINDEKKGLVVAMADMDILEHDARSADVIAEAFESVWLPQRLDSKTTHIVIDANWSPIYLVRWIELSQQMSSRVLYEPVSNAKAARLFHLPVQQSLRTFPRASVDMAVPNEYELSSLYTTAKDRGFFDQREWWQVIDSFGIPSSGVHAKLVLATSGELVARGIPQKSLQLLPYLPCIMTKLGSKGVLVTQIIPAGDPRLQEPAYAGHILAQCNNGTDRETGVGGVYMRLFPPAEMVDDADIISVNGVGDTFAGVLVAGLAKRAHEGLPERVEDLIDIAQRASVLTLKSSEAVSPGLGVLSMLL